MIDLLPGDVFVVHSGGILSDIIQFIETIWARDKSATHTHCGIITASDGTTFEALWKTQRYNLSRYEGHQICIARPFKTINGGNITLDEKRTVIRSMVRDFGGDIYPVHRLFLYLIPPLARRVGTGSMLVCSELVAEYLKRIGARGESILGTNPDDLYDDWQMAKNFDIVYEGTWK